MSDAETTELERQAKLTADRVGPEVGFDPLTILTLLTTLLPLLGQCFNRNDEPNPALAAASIKRYHDRAPEQLRRRTARRVRAEADQPMTKEQSFILADAIIAQALSLHEVTLAACCSEAGK